MRGRLRAPAAQAGTSTGRSRWRRPRGSTPGITDRTDCSTPGITVACGCPGWGNPVKPHLGPRGRGVRATVSRTLQQLQSRVVTREDGDDNDDNTGVCLEDMCLEG